MMKQINFYTDEVFFNLEHLPKPYPTWQYKPDWTKLDIGMKYCPGLMDLLEVGYIIPMWADVKIHVDENGFRYETNWQDKPGAFTAFPPQSTQGYNFGEEWLPLMLKMQSPWRISVPKGYSLLYTRVHNNEIYDYEIQDGIIDQDNPYGPHAEVNAVFKIKKNKTITIKKGTPLIKIIPIKLDKFESSFKVVDDKQNKRWYAQTNLWLKRLTGYRKLFWYGDKKSK